MMGVIAGLWKRGGMSRYPKNELFDINSTINEKDVNILLFQRLDVTHLRAQWNTLEQ